MKTVSKFSAYEAPQAELLQVCVEQNLLLSATGTAGGQDITWSEDESDFDDFFNN